MFFPILLLLLVPTVLSTQNSAGRVNINGVSYNYYYLCGSYPNQFASLYPCQQQQSACKNCNTCNRCSSGQYCRQLNRNWSCVNGCCRNQNTNPAPQPVCGGREVSGGYCRQGRSCGRGFLCTGNNVCCRCATGTSIGECVNGLCPQNFSCNSAGQCCPTQVSG